MAWLEGYRHFHAPAAYRHRCTAAPLQSSHLNTSQHGLALFVGEDCRTLRIQEVSDQLAVLHSSDILKYSADAGANKMQGALSQFRPTFWGLDHDGEGWPRTRNPAGIGCGNHWLAMLIQTSLRLSLAHDPQVSTYSSDHLSAGSSGIHSEDGPSSISQHKSWSFINTMPNPSYTLPLPLDPATPNTPSCLRSDCYALAVNVSLSASLHFYLLSLLQQTNQPTSSASVELLMYDLPSSLYISS